MGLKLITYLGGADTVKQKAPLVYELLENAIPETGENNLLTAAQDNSVYNDDTIDIYLSVDQIFSDDSGIQTLLRANFTQLQQIVTIATDIYDAKTNELLDTDCKYFENIIYQEHRIVSGGKLARSAAKGDIRAEATFTWSTDGKAVKEKTISFQVAQFYENSSIFTDLQVTKPRAGDKKLTVVLYDRTAVGGETPDYTYNNVKLEGNRVKLKMPFQGFVTVRDNLEIRGVMTKPKEEKPKLFLSLEKDGTASYNNAKTFEEQCIISEDKHTLSWAIDDDWNTILDVSHFSASTILDLTCRFSLKVVDPTKPFHILNPIVMINSVSNALLNTTGVCEIEKISIRWGCVAADTLVTMADFSQKMISEIRIGDMVATDSGYACVRTVYTGMEDELLHLETMNGKTLRVTSSHPIKTTEGFLRAADLNAKHNILTLEGASQVKYIYPEPYGEMVYNLELETSAPILCGGIIAGDFEMQNSLEYQQANQEPTPLQMEFRKLFEGK